MIPARSFAARLRRAWRWFHRWNPCRDAWDDFPTLPRTLDDFNRGRR